MLRLNNEFGIKDISRFAELALSILEIKSADELAKVKNKVNQLMEAALANSTGDSPVTSQSFTLPFTILNIIRCFRVLCHAQAHLLGELLDDTDLQQVSKLLKSLNELMEAGLMYDIPHGPDIYLLNSYLSLSSRAVGCLLHQYTDITDEGVIVDAATFVNACAYDQDVSSQIIKQSKSGLNINYLELAKGFYVVESDNQPSDTYEKLIFAFNRMVVDTLFKMRYRLRSSHALLTRANALLMQMNLWQMTDLRDAYSAEQASFKLSTDNLETKHLQADYVPVVSGLMGRINDADTVIRLHDYLIRSYQLIQQLFRSELIARITEPNTARQTQQTIKQLSMCLTMDLQILTGRMKRHKNLPFSEEGLKIIERDIVLLNEQLQNSTKHIAHDFEQQFVNSYRFSTSGMYAELMPKFILSQTKDGSLFAARAANLIEDLIKRFASQQTKDMNNEARYQLGRTIKDFYLACMSAGAGVLALRRAIPGSKINALAVDPACDKAYELLISLEEANLKIDQGSIESYLTKINIASVALDLTSKRMSIMSFRRFFAMALSIIQTVMLDRSGRLDPLQGIARLCFQRFDDFRKNLADEASAIITAIDSIEKKYYPAAAITLPADTKSELSDYIVLATRIMRAESEEGLLELAGELDGISAHPIILPDAGYIPSRQSFNECALHLHDLLQIVLVARTLSLQLPVQQASLTDLKKRLRDMEIASRDDAHDSFLSRVIKFYFKLVIQLAQTMLASDDLTLSELSANFLVTARACQIKIPNEAIPVTAKFPARIIKHMANSCEAFFERKDADNVYVEFVTELRVLLMHALLRARTRVYHQCEKEKKLVANAKDGQKTRSYHILYIATNTFDNVLARLGTPGETTQSESTKLIRLADRLLDDPIVTPASVFDIAKATPDLAMAGINSRSEQNIGKTLKYYIRMTDIYTRLYRGFLRKKLRRTNEPDADQVLFASKLFNVYLTKQLTFLCYDLYPHILSGHRGKREMSVINVLKLYLRSCHLGMKNKYDIETLQKVLAFNIDTVEFDDYFTQDLCQITIAIIGKRFDYYYGNATETSAQERLTKFMAELRYLIQKVDGASDAARPHARRFVMEYYLRVVTLAAKLKCVDRVRLVHESVFNLCKGDKLFPFYEFIYHGYKNLSGLVGSLSRAEGTELFKYLKAAADVGYGQKDHVLEALSPNLYIYVGQLAEKVVVSVTSTNKHIDGMAKITGLALFQVINESLDDSIITAFISKFSAVNSSHLRLTAEDFGLIAADKPEAYFCGIPITLDDYFALAVEILNMQDATQAARTAEKLASLPRKPIITLDAKFAAMQDEFNATTFKLHKLLTMLHVTCRQSLALPVTKQELEQHYPITDILLRVPSEIDAIPVVVYALEMMMLTAALASQFTTIAVKEITPGLIAGLSSPARMVQNAFEVELLKATDVEKYRGKGTNPYLLFIDMLKAFDELLSPTNSDSLYHKFINSIARLTKRRYPEIQKCNAERIKLAESMLKNTGKIAPDQELKLLAVVKDSKQILSMIGCNNPAETTCALNADIKEPAEVKPVKVEPAVSVPVEVTQPKSNDVALPFESLFERFQHNSAEVSFDDIARVSSDVLSSKKYTEAMRVKAATMLSNALLHQLEGTTKLAKRESLRNMLQSSLIFVNKQDKKAGSFIKDQIKKFEDYVKELTKPVEVIVPNDSAQVVAELPAIEKLSKTETEKTNAEVNSASNSNDTVNTAPTVVDVQSAPEQQPKPVVAPAIAIVGERIDFDKLKTKLSDVQFQAVCERCADEDADECFNKITKFCLGVFNNKQHHIEIRVQAILSLAQALMYRAEESHQTSKRDGAYKALQGFQLFVNKNMVKASKEFSEHLVKFDAYHTNLLAADNTSRPANTSTPVTISTPAKQAPAIRILQRPKAEKASLAVQPATQVAAIAKPKPAAVSSKNPTLFASVVSEQSATKVETKASPSPVVEQPQSAHKPDTAKPAASTTAVLQRMMPAEIPDESLLPLRVAPSNRLLQHFQLQPTEVQNRLLEAMLGLNQDVYLYGNAVLSPLFHARTSRLKFVCFMPKAEFFKLLTFETNSEALFLKEIIEHPQKDGFLIRLDENKLQAEQQCYYRTDLLIEVRCLSGSNRKAALKQFCHDERLTSTLFYDVRNRCLIDAENHARCTAVYPVMYMDQRHNISGELDVMRVSPAFTPSTRDNRDVILDALLQLSSHHHFLGCGLALKSFVGYYKHELKDHTKKQMPIEWFDELFLNHNACHTARWLINFDMIHDLFPQLHPDFANDLIMACEEQDKASFVKHYSCMTYAEILRARALFLLNTLFRSFKQSINVIDYLQEDGLSSFMERFCTYTKDFIFEWIRVGKVADIKTPHAEQASEFLDQMEITISLFWDTLLSEAIPAIHAEFFRSNTEGVYGLDDQERMKRDLLASLAADGFPDRNWLVQMVWQYHEQQCRNEAKPVATLR